MILAPSPQVGEVGEVLSLVLEEGVHVLDPVDSVLFLGHPGEIQVVQLPRVQGPVQGPFGQGNTEEGFSRPPQAGRGRACTPAG